MADKPSSAPQLDRAPIRRVITGHTPEGKSTVIEDAPIAPHPFHGSTTLFTDLYWTDQSPPSNEVEFKDLVKDHPDEIYPPVGSSLKVVEMPPGVTSVSYSFIHSINNDTCYSETINRSKLEDVLPPYRLTGLWYPNSRSADARLGRR